MERLKSGVDEWNTWRKANPDVKIDLTNANIRGANLSNADLVGADLTNANLVGVNLTNADLVGADLINAILVMANLSNADLMGANLSGASIYEVRWDRSKMRGKYEGIRLDSCFGNALFKRDAADQDFLDTLEGEWGRSWRRHLFGCWGLIDYGRSLWRISALAFGLIIFFGAIYSIWPHLLGYTNWVGDSISPRDHFTPFYFSIVTYTTLGFGDVSPKGHMLGEIIVSFEVILGYVTLGLLISVLGNKVARRS